MKAVLVVMFCTMFTWVKYCIALPMIKYIMPKTIKRRLYCRLIGSTMTQSRI
jgi:hypothetical protein